MHASFYLGRGPTLAVYAHDPVLQVYIRGAPAHKSKRISTGEYADCHFGAFYFTDGTVAHNLLPLLPRRQLCERKSVRGFPWGRN